MGRQSAGQPDFCLDVRPATIRAKAELPRDGVMARTWTAFLLCVEVAPVFVVLMSSASNSSDHDGGAARI